MKKRVFIVFHAVFLLLAAGFLSAEPEAVILDRHDFHFYSPAPFLEDAKIPGRYAPENLFDRRPDSSWAIGDGGPGTVIYVSIPVGAEAIRLINGYAANDDLFSRNNRVGTIKTELCTAYSFPDRVSELGQVFDVDPLGNEKLLVLQDTIKPQSVSLGTGYWQKAAGLIEKSEADFKTRLSRMDETEREFFKKGLIFLYLLRIEIMDVYRGTRWNDTCLSELGFVEETRFIPDERGITGFWETRRGADYEEIDFQDDGYVFSYSGTRPFGSGRWSLERGFLKVEWDHGEEEIFSFFYREGSTLTLMRTGGAVVQLRQ